MQDDKGCWNQRKAYRERHSDVDFSHGSCSKSAYNQILSSAGETGYMNCLKKMSCVQIVLIMTVCFFVATVSGANNTRAEKLVVSIVSQESPIGKLTREIAKVMCDRADGIDFEFVSLPIARSMDEFANGFIDIEGPRNTTIEKNFPNIVKIPEAIFINDLVAFSKDSNIKLSGWNSLKKYKVAYLRGWKIYENNVKNVKNLDVLDNQEALFQFLDEGRADLILLSRIEGFKIIAKLNLKGIVAIEPPLAVKKLYLYINKKHERLAPVFAKILLDMKRDGTYRQIYSQTIGD